MRDWLFQWPAVPAWDELADALEAELAHHPDAAAISDEEAEQFAAVAWGLSIFDIEFIREYCDEFGVDVPPRTEKGRRRGVVALLRLWTHDGKRKVLANLPWRVRLFEGLPAKDLEAGKIDWPKVAIEVYAGMSLVWIFRVLQLAKMPEQVEDCLAACEWARHHLRAWRAGGKLLMKRLLWQKREEAEAQAERQALERQALKLRYQRQEALIKSLSKDVAEVARRRDALRRAAEGTQANARALLEQARAEVAVATTELEERKTAHARELAAMAAQFESRITELTRLLDEVRSEQAAALRERGRRGAGPLTGLTFAVTGPAENGEVYKALIESAGGRMVKENAQVRITLGKAGAGAFSSAESGLADLERVIRNQVLPQVLALRAGRS